MPTNQPPKPKNNNEKLVIGLVVGAVLGFLLYWVLGVVSVHSETIFLILVSVAFVLALLLIVLVWFRQRLIKRFFGKDIQFNTVLDDTHEVIDAISTNTVDQLPIEKEKKQKLKDFAPKLVNYLIWSNFRNWGLRIFTSFVLGLGGIVTTILIINQNKLFELQNVRIEQQTHLIEADRRSAQVFILGEILSDINAELKDTLNQRKLSNTLVGRIISVSRAMRAYRYLDGDSLIEHPLSPERGQLLISLLESQIDSLFFEDRILGSCDFRESELEAADLNRENLQNAYLEGSNLKSADLKSSNLSYAWLNKSNLESAQLSNAIMLRTKLNNANLKFSTFGGANLEEAQLQYSKLYYADLTGANLKGAYLDSTDLTAASLVRCNLKDVDLSNVKSLDSVKIERRDWLYYIRDSLELEGSERIFNEYKIDSAKIHPNADYKILMLLRKK